MAGQVTGGVPSLMSVDWDLCSPRLPGTVPLAGGGGSHHGDLPFGPPTPNLPFCNNHLLQIQHLFSYMFSP